MFFSKMWLIRVSGFLAVFVLVISESCLSGGEKDDLEKNALCRSCIEAKNTSCIARICGNDDCNNTIIPENFNDTTDNRNLYNPPPPLPPPYLYCQDENLLALVWNVTRGTTYFLEYSVSNEQRNYTELTSYGYETIEQLRPGTFYTIQLTSLTLINDDVRLRRSRPINIRTLRPHRTPFPVSRVYIDSLVLVDDTYNALIKWQKNRDLSCFYDIVYFGGDDVGDYKQIEISNPLSLHEVNISDLHFGQNYSLSIRAISEGRYGRTESSELQLSILVPACLDTYESLEKCAPETPQNFEVEEIFVDANNQGTYPLYDIKMNWTKPKYIPDFYMAYIHNYLKHSSSHINITGESTNATYRNVELGTYYEISLVAYSEKGPSSPATLSRYVNGTIASIVPTNSWISMELILIITCPFVIVGLVLMLVFNHHLVKKTRTSYFKELEEKHSPTVSYIFTGKDISEKPDEWEIHSDRLSIKDILGEGAFGVVRRGCVSTEQGNNIEVAIKMLRDNPTQDEIKQFYQEIDIMKSVPPHPHLVSLIGCITRGTKGPYLVVEYCAKGDLQSYLRSAWDKLTNSSIIEHVDIPSSFENTKYVSNKLYDLHISQDEKDIPQPKDLISFARQIVLGMEYLSSLKLIHRDLAARNILVSENNIVKISDFGLSRDVYHDRIYCKTTNGKLPIRWMALESMTHQVYTIQSDVWSFGILLWEIITLGSTPYPGVSTVDLLPLLKSGYRMEKPSNCSDELYAIMCKCWKAAPRERPTFSELRITLDRLLESVSYYLNLSLSESTNISVYRKGDLNKYKNVNFSEGYVTQFKGI